MIGRRAAAAADDIDQAGRGEFAEQRRHFIRALVIAAEFVGQSGIRISAYKGIGDPGQFGDVGAQLPRA